MGEGFPPPDKITISDEIFEKLSIKFEKLLAVEARVKYYKKYFSEFELPDESEAGHISHLLETAEEFFSRIDSIHSNLPAVGSELGLKELEIIEGMIEANTKALSGINDSITEVISQYEVPTDGASTAESVTDTPLESIHDDETDLKIDPAAESGSLIASDFDMGSQGENTDKSATATTTPLNSDIATEASDTIEVSKDSTRRKRPGLHDQHVRERLIFQLLDDEEDVDGFWLEGETGAPGRKRKSIWDLKRDIDLVFRSEGVKKFDIDNTFNPVFDVQAREIESVYATKKPGEKLTAAEHDRIKSAYRTIRNEAAALVMTTSSDRATNGVPEESTLLRDVESIRDDIHTASILFENYKKRLESSTALESDECKEVEREFELINKREDSDVKVLSIILERHLTAIWRKIDAFQDKFPVADSVSAETNQDDESKKLQLLNKKIVEIKKEYQELSAVFPIKFIQDNEDAFRRHEEVSTNLVASGNSDYKSELIDQYTASVNLIKSEFKRWQENSSPEAELNKVSNEFQTFAKNLPDEFKSSNQNFAELANRLEEVGKSSYGPVFLRGINPELMNLLEAIKSDYEKWQETSVPDAKPGAKPESLETLDEKIDRGVEDYRVFYESLPDEFKSESEALRVLDKAINKLLVARYDINIISKASVVGAFMTAFSDAKAEYEDWQKNQNSINNTGPDPTAGTRSTDSGDPTALLGLAKEPPKSEPPFTINPDGVIDVQAAAVSPDRAYSIHRTRSLEAKKAYRLKEENFNTALKEHYNSAGFIDRLTSPKKVLGINADLPPALAALRDEYRQARDLYARSLSDALSAREAVQAPGKAAEDIYNIESDSTRLAFARKFILKPQEAQLEMQELKILSPALRETKKRLVESLSKHKWLIRGGVVTLAGIAGGLSGGVGLAVAGASWKAARIAGSAYVGSVASKHAYDYFAPGVEKAEIKLGEINNDLKDSFKVEDLFESSSRGDVADAFDSIGADYAKALLEKNSAKTKQKVAAGVAAVVAGGTTGLGVGLASADSLAEAAEAGKVPVAPGVKEEMTNNGPQTTSPEETVANDEANQRIAEEILRMQRGPVIIDSMSIAQYTLQGVRLNPEILSDITFGPGAKLEAIPEAERMDVMNDIRVLSEDIYTKHIPEREFEARLFESMEKKFGSAPWWKEANFTKVDVGKFPVPEPATAIPTPEPTESAPVVKEPEPKAGVVNGALEKISTASEEVLHVVKTGDTVSKVVLDNFSDKLSGLSDIEKGQVMDKLFNKFDQDPILLKELGVKSDSVDLIRPGDNLDLDVLERELDNVLSTKAADQVVKTGGLKVAVDSEVRPLKINVKTPPAPEVPVAEVKPSLAEVAAVKQEVSSANSFQKVTAAADKVTNQPKVLSMPTITPLNGQYLEHPAYTKLINELYGNNGKGFDNALVKAITNMEKNTYDFTDTMFGGGYSSPYTILNSMTVKGFEEFSQRPSDVLRYDLQQNNIKYETYLLWADLISDMKEELPHQPNTTIGDMFSRLLLDDEVAKHNIKVKVETA